MQNFSHILTRLMPKSSLLMFYLYFALEFKYFLLKSFQKIEFQNFHAFLSTECLFTFLTF